MEVDFSIGRIWETIRSKVAGWLEATVEMLPNFVVAILVILFFYILARLIRKLLQKILKRFFSNHALNALIAKIVYVGIILLGLTVALSVLKLEKTVTSLLAGAGIAGLAISFAFQDIAANFVSGGFMALHQPFRKGDLIRTNDLMGTVTKLSLRTTSIETFQGQEIAIPNRLVFKEPLVNFTKNGKRRIDLEVGVHYDSDLEKAQELAVGALKELDNGVGEITCFYSGFGDSSINFVARYWISRTDQSSYLQAVNQGVIRIKKAFDRENITIPFPIRTLDIPEGTLKGLSGAQQKGSHGEG